MDNLARDMREFITNLAIEEGSPADTKRFLPIILDDKTLFNVLTHSFACDGAYVNIECYAGTSAGYQVCVFISM